MQHSTSQTMHILEQFHQAFVQHDPSLLDDLIADDCVMESVEPAPDGTRYAGRAACLAFWRKLADSRDGEFSGEAIVAGGDHGTIRWRYRFGPDLAQSIRGVTVMRVRDGRISEAHGYVKSGNASAADPIRDAISPP